MIIWTEKKKEFNAVVFYFLFLFFKIFFYKEELMPK